MQYKFLPGLLLVSFPIVNLPAINVLINKIKQAGEKYRSYVAYKPLSLEGSYKR